MYKYEHPIPLAALNNSALFIEDKPLAQQQQNPQQQQQQQQNPQQQQQQNPQQQQQNPQQQLKEGESEEKKEENQNQEKNENEERKNEVKLNKNEKNIVVVDLKTNEKKILFTGNIISKQITREFIDFIVDSNIIVRIDLVNKDKFDIELIEEPSADDQKSSNSDKFYKILIDLSSCFAWKIFNSTNFAFLLKDNFSLVVVDSSGKTQKVETCEKNETVILFDIIDDHGKPNYRNGSFILVVTSAHVSIFVVDQKSGKIKRVRHVSTSSVVIEASITSWGILLLRMLTSVQMITLPDPSYSAIGTLPIDEMTSKATLIKYEGLICFEAENNLVTIYLRDDDLPPCFSPAEHPPIEPPKSTGMKKLFGKKTATLQEADESFQYKRAPEKNPAGTIAETQEIMQQLLSKAAERGDALNELEIKAEHLMKSAQMFRKNVRKFRK
ncbi:hypothetical protein TRFO_35213 [Tritrichomonas foetus]|uniref:V-SNARE coiled-coil homology domain-containing protein n=1 Tax=Tritrichomonas foetus TaxID=1144522 RepID=A0A1J4JGX4_9EUKA|nr:hypothetical protein TRFO_35213 [Tritrichomonas foetus]|eukprot:OHS98398.1 hypothetical protein TRFO_35213 [Tritrichomonas foetus]